MVSRWASYFMSPGSNRPVGKGGWSDPGAVEWGPCIHPCTHAWRPGIREDRAGRGAVITHEACYRGVLGCLNELLSVPHIPGTLGGTEAASAHSPRTCSTLVPALPPAPTGPSPHAWPATPEPGSACPSGLRSERHHQGTQGLGSHWETCTCGLPPGSPRARGLGQVSLEPGWPFAS